MSNLMKEIKEHYEKDLKKDYPDFNVGDNVKVWIRVVEGNKSRLQAFQGNVIRKKGKGVEATFTVRRVSMDIGVERTFPLLSPAVEKVEIIKKGKVRRSKLYYLRDRKGKAARIKELRKK